MVVWMGKMGGLVVKCVCEGVEGHHVCKGCEVVNKYGERLGSLDAGTFILERNPASCLRQNFVWCNEQRKFLIREQGRMLEGRIEGMDDVVRKEEDAEMERQIKEAAEDFEAASEEVARVKEWILAFWDAIGKQERATRMRRGTEEAAAAAEGDKEGEEGDGTDDSGFEIL